MHMRYAGKNGCILSSKIKSKITGRKLLFSEFFQLSYIWLKTIGKLFYNQNSEKLFLVWKIGKMENLMCGIRLSLQTVSTVQWLVMHTCAAPAKHYMQYVLRIARMKPLASNLVSVGPKTSVGSNVPFSFTPIVLTVF